MEAKGRNGAGRSTHHVLDVGGLVGMAMRAQAWKFRRREGGAVSWLLVDIHGAEVVTIEFTAEEWVRRIAEVSAHKGVEAVHLAEELHLNMGHHE